MTVLITCEDVSFVIKIMTITHRRRSDWNSGGTHDGTYYKSPAVEAKKHIFLHCNAGNLVLKILQHDKIWGGGQSPRSKFWGDLSPLRHLRPCHYFQISCHVFLVW